MHPPDRSRPTARRRNPGGWAGRRPDVGGIRGDRSGCRRRRGDFDRAEGFPLHDRDRPAPSVLSRSGLRRRAGRAAGRRSLPDRHRRAGPHPAGRGRARRRRSTIGGGSSCGSIRGSRNGPAASPRHERRRGREDGKPSSAAFAPTGPTAEHRGCPIGRRRSSEAESEPSVERRRRGAGACARTRAAPRRAGMPAPPVGIPGRGAEGRQDLAPIPLEALMACREMARALVGQLPSADIEALPNPSHDVLRSGPRSGGVSRRRGRRPRRARGGGGRPARVVMEARIGVVAARGVACGARRAGGGRPVEAAEVAWEPEDVLDGPPHPPPKPRNSTAAHRPSTTVVPPSIPAFGSPSAASTWWPNSSAKASAARAAPEG